VVSEKKHFETFFHRKSKMAATAGHRLTWDPTGRDSKDFSAEATYLIKAKLYMNVHWMVLYKLHCIFPIWTCVNTMTCGGSHLGFLIGIKNRGPSNDHSWAVWL
jgi:hypothetical protein